MSKHWTNYWEQGYLTSFGGGFKGNYQGELKHFWESVANIQSSNVKLLDIGTGNGALIKLIQANKMLNCVGIDKACINSNVTDTIEAKFLSEIEAENLPFSDDEFDLVIGQFSIEYTKLNASVDEVFRVLKKNGNFVFVCHLPDSIIVKPNESILNAAFSIKRNALPNLELLIEALVNGDSVTAQQKFHLLSDFIDKEFATDKDGLIGTNFPAFLSFLKQSQDKKIDFKRAFELFVNELELLILRLSELLGAANSTHQLVEMLKLYRNDIEVGKIIDERTKGTIALYLKYC